MVREENDSALEQLDVNILSKLLFDGYEYGLFLIQCLIYRLLQSSHIFLISLLLLHFLLRFLFYSDIPKTHSTYLYECYPLRKLSVAYRALTLTSMGLDMKSMIGILIVILSMCEELSLRFTFFNPTMLSIASSFKITFFRSKVPYHRDISDFSRLFMYCFTKPYRAFCMIF